MLCLSSLVAVSGDGLRSFTHQKYMLLLFWTWDWVQTWMLCCSREQHPKFPWQGAHSHGRETEAQQWWDPHSQVHMYIYGIAVFPRNINVSASWSWSALTLRSHFFLQMSVWGSRSEFSVIFHLEFLPTSKFFLTSRRSFTWQWYEADLKDNYILQFL